MRAAILPAQGQAICVTVIVLALIAAATARKAAAVRSSAQMQRTVISGWLRLSSAATAPSDCVTFREKPFTCVIA